MYPRSTASFGVKTVPQNTPAGQVDPPPASRILIVEDEPKTRAAIAEALQLDGAIVTVAPDGRELFRRLEEEAYDLIILDWMLSGPDGLDLLRNLRGRGFQIPILMLSARAGLRDRVLGLDCGADDYLTKPFAVAELLARCRAHLRRPILSTEEFLRYRGLQLDVRNRVAYLGGEKISLTHQELAVLEYLLRYQGQVVSRATLAREVWQQTGRSAAFDNMIDAQMMRLRKKIDGNRPEKIIHTLRGVGYRLGEEQPDPWLATQSG